MNARRAAAALFLASLSLGAAACYKPNLVDGGFRCGDAGVCPDGFRCRPDGLCHSGAFDAAPDVPVPPMCKSVTPDAATCTRDLAPGQACTPACESGCSCGWCAVVNGVATCLTGTPGTKTVGDVCDPSSAKDCAPGLFCRAECGTGHCYKYCDSNSDCPVSGTTCTINGPSGVKLCSFPQTQCDAILNTGCLQGFACFFTGTTTECDCPGSGGADASCGYVAQCMPGYSCADRRGDAGATCVKVCRSGADCPSPLSCTMVGSYGYCL